MIELAKPSQRVFQLFSSPNKFLHKQGHCLAAKGNYPQSIIAQKEWHATSLLLPEHLQIITFPPLCFIAGVLQASFFHELCI